jgi:hypothetical protein
MPCPYEGQKSRGRTPLKEDESIGISQVDLVIVKVKEKGKEDHG